MLEITILGCGPSAGVPTAGYDKPFWGRCDPCNPKNNRTRASIYLVYRGEGLLVDTGPDLRQHMLRHNLTQLHEIIITHDHADHVHGLDELRPLFFSKRKSPWTLKADADTLAAVTAHFSYLFGPTQNTLYPHILQGTLLSAHWMWHDLPCASFPQNHGYSVSQGLRFGNVAYSTDFVDLDDYALSALQNLDVWIVDCLGRKPRKTHCHLEKTLMWIDCVKPKKAILTHMNHELDYEALCKELPPHIQPAYDGMTIHLD